jgi:hypothetical protein
MIFQKKVDNLFFTSVFGGVSIGILLDNVNEFAKLISVSSIDLSLKARKSASTAVPV